MKTKYVSFDVYNTLIKRVISINDIYNFMEITLKEKYNIKIANFKEKRIQAETNARIKYGNNYNINDIYNCFPENIKKSNLQKIIALEKQSEIFSSVVNEEGLALYNKYVNKYKIIAISDMFLDKETIKKILKQNGYNIDTIYVSCEEKKSKKEFNLFIKVIKDLNIKNNELMHIGDAIRSDYLNPKILGIKSILVKNKTENNYYYNLGFQKFGPLMYEFCKFIKNNSNSNLFFVSREGEIFKKCFDFLYPNIKTNMIYLSRKSVLAGVNSILLNDENLNEFIKNISIKRNETILEFLERLSLDTNKYKTILNKNNINEKSLLSSIDLEVFLKNNKEILINDLKEKNYLFDQYLNSTIKGKTTIIDIGWKGSMQDLLSKYLKLTNSSIKLNGLYLGVMNNKNKKGFLFNDNNEICQNILNYSGLLEIIFMPNYGSVLGYKKVNNNVVPIFDKVEFSDQSLSIIKEVQNGIFDYLKKMKLFNTKIMISKNKIINILDNLGNKPTLKDINYLKKLNFYDNGRLYYLVEPISIINFKTNFLNTKWKTAYLKKLFKINLPYGKLIKFLRKIN